MAIDPDGGGAGEGGADRAKIPRLDKQGDQAKMAIDSDGGGAGEGGADRAKIPRLDKQGDQAAAVGAGADAAPVDRLSQLPKEVLQEHILMRLPLKDAIRTGVLARSWRELWKTRWGTTKDKDSCPVVVRGSHDALLRELKERECKGRPVDRIDCFSLVIETSSLTAKELNRFVKYTVECHVADLHVESRKEGDLQSFPVPKSSRELERLSLRNFRISNQYYHEKRPKFLALGVIQLHHCSISNNTAFQRMLKWSPSLLTLDLRGCTFVDRWEDGYPLEGARVRLVMPPNLRTLTIVECGPDERSRYCSVRWKARVDSVHVPSLRSFRYSGDFIDSPFTLPRAAALDDLYILFSHSSSASEKYNDVKLIEYLPEDLSRLNVLTISGNALRAASSLPDGGGPAQLPSLNLHNLRELQLLMFELEAVHLSDLYVFLKACPCPNLERLFVQLRESDYNPLEGSIDEAREEPPENGLDNLLTVKFMEFNWHHTAVQLVSFLLRKARSLRKLLLVSTARDVLDLKIAQHTDLREARADGKLLLRWFDDAAAPQPYHSEVFIEL